MNWKFEEYLTEQLTLIKRDIGLESDIVIVDEQLFATMEEMKNDTIYVVIKFLNADIVFSAKQQPIQLLILSEANQLDNAKLLFNQFVNSNNFKAITEGTDFIKQQYSTPIVLSNYEDVSYGMRSVLLVTGTIFMMENIVDIGLITINNVEFKPLSCSISYVMSGNTQQVAGEKIASTEKNVSTFSMTLTISSLSTYVYVDGNNNTYNLVDEILKVVNGTSNGGTKFAVSFSIGTIQFSFSLVLVNFSFTTAVNDIPALVIGLQK